MYMTCLCCMHIWYECVRVGGVHSVYKYVWLLAQNVSSSFSDERTGHVTRISTQRRTMTCENVVTITFYKHFKCIIIIPEYIDGWLNLAVNPKYSRWKHGNRTRAYRIAVWLPSLSLSHVCMCLTLGRSPKSYNVNLINGAYGFVSVCVCFCAST